MIVLDQEFKERPKSKLCYYCGEIEIKLNTNACLFCRKKHVTEMQLRYYNKRKATRLLALKDLKGKSYE